MPAPEICRLVNVRSRFGATLKERRLRRQLTQEQLAEASGLSYKFVGELERGQGNPTLETLARLAAALDVTMADLVGESDRHPRPQSAEYRISKRDLQVVRDAAASLGAFMEHITSPPYRIKRSRKRS